jgi:nucleoside-diphosphate-sugar epimerase
MNILVAGGAGFIGSNLVAKLLGHGHAVTVIDNFSTGRRTNLVPLLSEPALRVIEADIVERVPDCGRFDRVYNLASPASPPGYQRLPVETLRVNSEGTRNLLETAQGDGARFLYASTSEAYGDPLEHPQIETYRGNVSSVGPRSMYDEGKRFGEALTIAYTRSRGVNGRIVRIFNTYGPNSDPADGRLVPNFITQALKREPLTIYADGSQTRSLCYVSDLVDGLYRAMESEEATGEVVNLGNPTEHTILDYARIVSRLTGAPPRFDYMPPAVGDDPQRRRPDITKAMQLLGWQPVVSLEDGLSRTIAYFRQALGLPEPAAIGAAGA